MTKLLKFFLKLLSIVPYRVLYVISDCVYYLLYYVIRYRRHVVRKNLTECFPEKSSKELVQIEKNFYHYFTDQVLESCKMATISPEEMRRRMKFVNVEAVNAPLRAGKSVGLYLGHYGNWEWVSSMPLWLEKSAIAAQIYHKLRNDDMDALMLHMRSRMGATCVDMHKTARFITELKAQNKVSIIGFIADQSPRKKEARYFIPFMHHSTPVLTGTEKIIKHYDFEAWFVHIKRVKRGFYEAEFVKMHDEPKKLPDFELTAIYYQMLEQMIRQQPELYLWTHNRFKHAEKIES